MKSYQLYNYEPQFTSQSKIIPINILESPKNKEFLESYNSDFCFKNQSYGFPIEIKSDGIYSGKFLLDPFFYSLRDIPWNIFISFHFIGEYRYEENSKIRKEYLETLIRKARYSCHEHFIHIGRNDVHPVFSEETIDEKTHIHGILYIKDHVNVNLRTFIEAIFHNIDWTIIQKPRREYKKEIIQIVDTPLAVAAYISKLDYGKYDKVFYLREKKDDYKKNGSFYSFLKMFLDHGFKKKDHDQPAEPFVDSQVLLAA